MIFEIENSFQSVEGYNCFACGPNHPFGLKLKFSFNDESNEVFSNLNLDILYAGFPGILHGGIQATILDELAFWGTWAKFQRSGFTYDMKIRYRRKCPVAQTIEARGIIGDLNHRLVDCQTVLKNIESGEIYSEGLVRYYLPDQEPRF